MGSNIDSRIILSVIDLQQAASMYEFATTCSEDEDLCLSAVAVRHNADATLTLGVRKVLDAWAARAVEDSSADKVPDAQINEYEVTLLLQLRPSLTSLIKELSSRLESAWRSKYGSAGPVPWVLEVHDVFRPGDGRAIHTVAKMPAVT